MHAMKNEYSKAKSVLLRPHKWMESDQERWELK